MIMGYSDLEMAIRTAVEHLAWQI